jgi:uncharacterized membrane protein YtjA (UPF0391 family)
MDCIYWNFGTVRFVTVPKECDMLYWAAVFFIIAIVAGILGFGGIAGAASSVAQILFFIFLVIFLIALISGSRRPPRV